jgi:hypothetical protein
MRVQLVATHVVVFAALLTGCAVVPKTTVALPAKSVPSEAFITHRGVLTARGRQFPMNGYLAVSPDRGQRLVITEQFGKVLADVLVQPGGNVHVVRSSRALRERWIREHVVADMQCVLDLAPEEECPGERLAPDRVRIQRRWYQLELTTVETRTCPQPASLFDPPLAGTP